MRKNTVDLVLFDMDGTLLKGRSIFIFAEAKNFTHQLHDILKDELEPYQKSIKIARLLQGQNISELLSLFRSIPLQNHVQDVVNELHKNNITTAIATDSYQILADDLKNRLGFQYAFGNELIVENKIITGNISINNKAKKKNSNGRIYSIHKSNILLQLCDLLEIKLHQTMAVGDGMPDIDMIKNAGIGVAYRAPPEVNKFARVISNNLRDLIRYT